VAQILQLVVGLHPDGAVEISRVIVRLSGPGERQEGLLDRRHQGAGRAVRSLDQGSDRRQATEDDDVLLHGLQELLDFAGLQGDAFLEGIEHGLVEQRVRAGS
jgi:hypothetical protein